MPEIISRQEAKALGLKKYFTGKPCLRGHLSHRYTADGYCTTCNLVRTAKYRRKHLVEERQRYRKWYVDDAGKRSKRASKRLQNINDLIAVLRVEMPDLLKEFGL